MGCRVNPVKVLLNFAEYNAKLASRSTLRDIEILRDIASKFTGKLGEQFGKTFIPEKRSEQAQATATAIIQRRAQSGVFNNQFANEIYRQLQFQEEFKNGDKAYRRDQYVDKYPKSVQTEMLMKSEEGKSTGDPAYDRMASVNKYIYGKLTELDEKEGISYEARNNYVKHLIDPTSQEAFESYIATHFKFADPGYMKPREFDTYRQAMAVHDQNGRPLFKMRTTSPERLLQVRIAEFSAARSKIQALQDLERRGLAWDTKGDITPDQIKQAWGNYRVHTANGRNFYVHPDAFQVINNAYNPSSMAGTLSGSFFEFLKTMKGLTVPFRLGLSLAHEDHLSRIRMADRWTNIVLRPGLPKAGDFITALADFTAQGIGLGGYPGMVRDAIKYGGVIHVLRGDRAARDADEIWAQKQLTDAGFRANISNEREMEFTNWLDERMPQLHQSLRKAGQIGEFSFKLASLQPLQRYIFSQVIPSVKAASLLEKISNLYKEHPELELSKNDDKRLTEVQKLGKQVDFRFGEMNWDNVFWTKAWKDVAIGSLLSASWQMGLIDYSVGAAKDLTKSALHMDQTIAKLRDQGVGPAFRKAVTDRALTSFFYTLATMARGAVISYAFTGGVNAFMDYFYPKIGINPDGTDKRLRQLDFAPEMLAWWEHSKNAGEGNVNLMSGIGGSLEMARNKMSPVLSSAWEALTNTSYYGGKITEHGWDWEGFLDRTGFFLKNTIEPFSVESVEQSGGSIGRAAGEISQGKVPTGTGDAVLAFFGLNQAPHWTQRTALENDIIRHAGEVLPKFQSKPETYQAMKAFQQAINTGDETETLEMYQTLTRLGKTPKQIDAIAASAKVPVAQKMFKLLPANDQAVLWAGMNDQEKATYAPLLKKAATEELTAGVPIKP